MKKPIFYVLEVLKTVGTGLFLLIFLYPIILIFMTSVKTRQEITINPSGLPQDVTFEYFVQAFNKMKYLQSSLNSGIIVVVVITALIFVASMAAYAIARRGGKYNILYYFLLAGMMVPFQMRMIPLYQLMRNLNLINNLFGVMLVYMSSLSPFAVFLLTGFVKSIPKELEEAAYIDGADMYRTFFVIVFPLLKGSLTTVAVLNTFTIWNDFLMPMLFLQSSNKLTLTVTLANFQGMYNNDWSMIFAAVCMIVLPMLVIYLFAQRFIINGITAGAVKG